MNVTSGGTLGPGASAGILGTGNVTLAAGATFKVELGGLAAGVGGYDRLNVTGTVSLGGATLNASILGGVSPVTGTQFVIIANDGADTVTGTFAGLAQGATVTAALGNTYSVSYVGGTGGNDVVLTALSDAVARDDAVTTAENAAIAAGNLLADNGAGADSNPESDPFPVTAVNGVAASVGNQITLASGAKLTVNANGTFSYNPNHAFDALPGPGSGASNLTGTDTFTYTVTSGDTATVTVTVSGRDSNGDVLQGTAGADTLNGGIGNDTMAGGTGNDSMAGGTGNDTYFVDAAGDVVTEAAGDALDRVLASVSYMLAAGVAVETMSTTNAPGTGVINLTGNGFANTIEGNAGVNALNGGGGNDRLIGLGGNDALDGGAGLDRLEGGAGNDTYTIDSASEVLVEVSGIDLVRSTVTKTLATGFENLTLLARRQHQWHRQRRRQHHHRQYRRQHALGACRQRPADRPRRQRHDGRRRWHRPPRRRRRQRHLHHRQRERGAGRGQRHRSRALDRHQDARHRLREPDAARHRRPSPAPATPPPTS